MENKRGWWYWLCVANTAFLFLALRGLFGKEAKEESEVALGDLGYAVFKLRYVLIVLAIIAVAAIVILLNEGPR
jgi:hypothetical protein